MSKLKELRQALGALVDKLNTDEVTKDAALYATTETEITNLKAQITRVEKAQAEQAALAAPVNVQRDNIGDRDTVVVRDGERTLNSLVLESRSIAAREGRRMTFEDNLSIARRGLNLTIDPTKQFRSLGEQLQAISAHYHSKGSNTDARLVRAPSDSLLNRAPSGAATFDPTAGGFLIQVDFMATIFMLAHDMGEILSRVNSLPISTNANGMKIPGVDESSRATGSRWGGISSKWAAEGNAGDESRPKFRMVEFDLKKLISKMTVTDEMLADAGFLTAIAMQGFSEEVMFMTEDAIVEGSGAGMPTGWLNSPAFISVPKETGQAAGTIVKENIDKMWARMWARSRKNAVWFNNQDIEPQLQALNGPVGTGGQLVYMPPGGISGAPYATLYGKPLVATEYNAALGTVGDLTLIDPSQYTIVDKGGVQMAQSMHVAFDTDETRFRITYRVDGKPMWSVALTPFKGSATKSPFIGLATR